MVSQNQINTSAIGVLRLRNLASTSGMSIVSTRFMSAVLAALNESSELSESDLNSIEAVRVEPVVEVDASAGPLGSEIRFAATVGSCMAKIRSGTLR
jgi:hypothetical protein